ncbi:MAG: HesA/MoeB/ThiF family protein [Polyangiales bacterium]
MAKTLRDSRVLIVGAGGLGCPAARVLARSGVGHITVLDDDTVDLTNLHRQTLYEEADAGAAKAAVAALRIKREAALAGIKCDTVAREIRIIPDNARSVVSGHDLVLEGADNFASKFLVADACALAGVPLVQGGAVRWVGWALGSVPGHSACLRCVFEDVPRGIEETCAAAGIVGPVAGAIGALQAAIAIRLLRGETSAASVLWSYDGLAGTLRRRRIERQPRCPLCSGQIRDTQISRYVRPEHAA